MPDGAKASRKTRASLAVAGGLTADELFTDLAKEYRKAKGQDKLKLGLELMPYFAPKMRSVDIQQTANVNVKITIGGLDGDN